MPKEKLTFEVLDKLTKEGLTQAQIARRVGVDKSTVSKAAKRFRVNTSKLTTLEKANKVYDKNLDAVSQLQKINDYANELLDGVMRWTRGDGQALQVLEGQMSKKKVRVGKKERLIERIKMKDPRELALKAMQEIRGQLNLQIQLFQVLYDMKVIEEFQHEVLRTIAEVDPEIRDQILTRLRDRRALRAAFSSPR